jgi:hypothetical protein
MRNLAAAAALAALTWVQPAAALTLEEAPPFAALPPPPPGVTGWDTLGRASVVFGEADGQETVTTVIPPRSRPWTARPSS